MNRIVNFTACLVLLLVSACGEPAKEENLRQGLEFTRAGNHQAAITIFKDVLEKDPNFHEARLQLGNAYFALGKLDSAENEYDKVQRQDPKNTEIALKLAQIYLQTIRTEKALPILSRLAAANPADPSVLTALAQCHAQNGDLAAGEEWFRKALQVKPANLDAQIGLARVLLATNRDSEMMLLLQQVITANPGSTAPYQLIFRAAIKKSDPSAAVTALQKILAIDPADLSSSYLLGLLYLDAGKVGEGRKVAEEINAKQAGHPAATRILGMADYLEGNYQQALTELQTSLKNMDDTGGHYFTGLTLYQLNQLEQAVSSFQRALDKQPEHVQSRLMLAQTLLKQRRADDSIQTVQAVLAKYPQNAQAHNLLGSAYLVKKQYDRAMTHLDKAIELDAGMAQAHMKKGIFNLATGNIRGGELELMNAVAAAPEVTNNRLLLASWYLKTKNYPAAVKTLKEGLRETPDSALIYNHLAAAYFAQKNVTEAIAALNKAKSLKPDYLAPYNNLANYHVSRQDYPAAINEYQQALKAVPDSPVVNLRLASLYELAGDKEQTEQCYEHCGKSGEAAGALAYAAYLQRTGRRDQALEILRGNQATHPDDPVLTKALGMVLENGGQFDEAVKLYAHLEELAPKSGNSLLIGAYLRKGNPAPASAIATRLISQQPGDEYGYLLQVSIKEYLREWPAAEETLRRGINQCKPNLSLRMKLAGLCSEQKRFNEAQQIYDAILREQPKFVPAIFAMGALNDLRGDNAKARELYRAALALDENYAPALNNLAYLQVETGGNPKEALALAARAFRMIPEDPGVNDTLGYSLLKGGQAGKSLAFLEKAARLRPDDATIQAHLAQAYKETGKTPTAPAGRTE